MKYIRAYGERGGGRGWFNKEVIEKKGRIAYCCWCLQEFTLKFFVLIRYQNSFFFSPNLK